jgi:hypothetical protein
MFTQNFVKISNSFFFSNTTFLMILKRDCDHRVHERPDDRDHRVHEQKNDHQLDYHNGNL